MLITEIFEPFLLDASFVIFLRLCKTLNDTCRACDGIFGLLPHLLDILDLSLDDIVNLIRLIDQVLGILCLSSVLNRVDGVH